MADNSDALQELGKRNPDQIEITKDGGVLPCLLKEGFWSKFQLATN
jgi:hypothetical protein